MYINKNSRAEGTPTIKQVLPSEKEKRSTDDLFVLLFTRITLQGIVCYTYKSVLWTVNISEMFCKAKREIM